jgi:hypothetical protein
MPGIFPPARYIPKILRVEIQRRRGKLQLNYHTDAYSLEELMATTLGRRILFTDNHEWTTEDIILAYRSQHHVEGAFRTMKNPSFVVWEPCITRTDQKIRVHALYCVMALTLAGLPHPKRAAPAWSYVSRLSVGNCPRSVKSSISIPRVRGRQAAFVPSPHTRTLHP